MTEPAPPEDNGRTKQIRADIRDALTNLPDAYALLRGVAPCLVEGCETPWFSRGLCRIHYTFHEYHGTLDQFPILRTAGDGYIYVHKRMRKLRGKASAYDCVDCGSMAEEWSYQGGAPDEEVSRYGRYSRLPDFYRPRCKQCHAKYDNSPTCGRGHLWSDNTWRSPSDGRRQCTECHRFHDRERRARRKAERESIGASL